MYGKNIFVIFFISLFILTFFLDNIYSKDKESLVMEKFAKKKSESLKNPHEEIDCVDCHGYKPDRSKETLKTVKFKTKDLVQLCLECHSSDSNIHPVNIKPSFKVPDHLPLDNEGKTTCVTCHNTHAKTLTNSLLRGFEEGRYKFRTDICYDCHGNSFSSKNPHLTQLGDRKCHYCHSAEPEFTDKENTVKFKVNVFALCDFCHNVIQKQHPLNVDLSISPPKTLPRDSDGNINCVTCHNPHGTADTVHYLRQEYVISLEEEKYINPHFSKTHCTTCHLTQPIENATKDQVDYKYGGNFIALCNSCHGTSANIHPVDIIPPPSMKVPSDLPLHNGKITCVTCHDAGFVNRATKYFLRGGENYTEVNDLCYRCHPKEEFKKMNPHLKMKEERKCMFCHIVPPDKGTKAENVKIKGSIKLLCVRCHSDHPHPSNFKHTVRPSMIVPKEFHLDDGNITCTTCHNPHLDIKKGEKTRRLRQGFSCKLCHVNL